MSNRILEIEKRLQQKYSGNGSPENLAGLLALTNGQSKASSTGFSRPVRSSFTRRESFNGSFPWRTRSLSSTQGLNLRFDVPLISQQTGMSCWAAGAAMIFGWREKISLNPEEIAKGAGEWASYSAGLHPENTSIFLIWGLTPEPQQSYSVEGFYKLLDTYGPLWVAGAVPGPHIRVVTAMYGDGTPEGTMVLINDPWEKGMTSFRLPNAGAQYEETYAQFVEQTEKLAIREAKGFPRAIYVARNSEPRLAGSQSRTLSRLYSSNGRRPTNAFGLSFLTRAMFVPVDFDVPRPVPDIRQPSPQTGWAAAAAMLVSYKEGEALPVEEAVRRAGSRYEQMLHNDSALAKGDSADFLSALGLTGEPVDDLSVDRLTQMLRRFGAVWLTPESDQAFSLDARILSGIHGDGTPAGTGIVVHDPGSGTLSTIPFNNLGGLFAPAVQNGSAARLLAIHWPPDTLGESLRVSAPSGVIVQQSRYAFAHNSAAAVIAGITVAEAAQIGLGAVSVVQASISEGSFTLTFDKAERLLTTQARQSMPGSQVPRTRYAHTMLFLGAGRINAAYAHVIIEWDGNSYGEIGTVYISRDLSTSTEWSRSSANMTITKINRIPLPNTDPRTWPFTYVYEGSYDPYGNGHFEFKGEFEINAFGGLKFNNHEVYSRSLADWAIIGTPYDYVRKGKDVIFPVPDIPQEQLEYLKENLP